MNKNKIYALGALLVFPFFSFFSLVLKKLINCVYLHFYDFEPYVLDDYLLRISRVCIYPSAGSNSYDLVFSLILFSVGCSGYYYLTIKKGFRILPVILFGYFTIHVMGLVMVVLTTVRIEFTRLLSFFHPFRQIFSASTYLDLPYYSLIIIVTLIGVVFTYLLYKKCSIFNGLSIIIFLFFYSLGTLFYYVIIHVLVNYVF